MHGTLRRLHGGQGANDEQGTDRGRGADGGRRHDRRRRQHGGQRRPGTTIDRFRLNELLSQAAFGGRRSNVYRRITALAAVRPGDAVLDVGCSAGYLVRKLASATGPGGRVTGVDPSEAAIGYGQRHAGPGLTFTVGTAQALPLPDESIDVVTSTLAIHHVPARRRQDALAEMYRVTKPGGRLLLADFDPARPPLPLHPGAKRTRRAAASIGSLEELAAQAGFQIESTGTLPLLRYVTAIRPTAPRTVDDIMAAGGERWVAGGERGRPTG
jgi:ubiquinone/menaquinone biosynthesis C-methylase UbiE